MIPLGQEVKDEVTGFVGIVIAKSEYLNGCIRYAVQAPMNKEGKVEEAEWIDGEQLTQTKRKNKFAKKEVKQSGGPQTTPKKSLNPKL